VVPLFQAGCLGIRQDEAFMLRFFEEFSSSADWFYFASGYFNFTSLYISAILRSKATFKILTSSPRVNMISPRYSPQLRANFQALPQKAAARPLPLS
jgi:hypothetical protein